MLVLALGLVLHDKTGVQQMHDKHQYNWFTAKWPLFSYCLLVCLSGCLFVQSFSQPSLIRFRSNLDICYMS